MEDGWPQHPVADAGRSAAQAQDVRAWVVEQNLVLQQKRQAMPSEVAPCIPAEDRFVARSCAAAMTARFASGLRACWLLAQAV